MKDKNVQINYSLTPKEKPQQEITERKLVEDRLRQSEERYRNLVELTSDIIYISDREGNQVFMNNAGYRILEASPEEVLGRQWSIWIHPEDRERSYKKFMEMIEKGIDVFSFENRYVSKSGKVINVLHNIRVLRNEKGEIIGTQGIARDITERKRVEESLKLFSEAVEGAPDGVQIVDLDGYITYSNRAVEEIYGFSHRELMGKHVNELNVDPEFGGKVIIPSIIKTGRWVGELMVKHKEGREFPIWLTASMVKDRNGKQLAMVGIISDITDRKRVEQAIKTYAEQLEEANRMKELFTDIMHHDLINPLNTANGFIEILKENETDLKKKTYLEIVERNLFKSMELIESATKLSKLESSKTIDYEDMDLKNVIDDVTGNFSHLAGRAGMEIENNINQCMPVKANKIIEEVFSNFISNAVKYASGGKRIVVNGEDGGECWILKVKDFGKGINDEDKKRIFERFRRMATKGVKGSGLGLAIARKIVELHRGSIWVEDNPDGGAVFVVEIPKVI